MDLYWLGSPGFGSGSKGTDTTNFFTLALIPNFKNASISTQVLVQFIIEPTINVQQIMKEEREEM
jgi:hypothetical protein